MAKLVYSTKNHFHSRQIFTNQSDEIYGTSFFLFIHSQSSFETSLFAPFFISTIRIEITAKVLFGSIFRTLNRQSLELIPNQTAACVEVFFFNILLSLMLSRSHHSGSLWGSVQILMCTDFIWNLLSAYFLLSRDFDVSQRDGTPNEFCWKTAGKLFICVEQHDVALWNVSMTLRFPEILPLKISLMKS